MIDRLVITDRKRACLPWWKDVPFLKRKKNILFKPGLNILWGPNGSGKSTVLKAIARMMHAEQGGSSFISQTSLSEVFSFSVGVFDSALTDKEREQQRYRDGVDVVHDGQAVVNFDPGHAVGLAAGSFDYDFMTEGIQNVMRKASSGQTTLGRMNNTIGLMLGKVPWPEVKWHISKKRVNDLWVARIELVEEMFKPAIPLGQPTLLLDEPDRSLDFPYQYSLWQAITSVKDRQIVVATHSVFAMNVPGAHYIETEKGYLDRCRQALRKAVPAEVQP